MTRLTPIVFTMGKVASTSVSTAIMEAGLPCLDIHSLSPDYLRKRTREFLDRGEFPTPHICVSMAWRDRLILHHDKCLYISLVRDPMARNLSAYFQNLHFKPAELRKRGTAQALFDDFMATYPHELPVQFFKRQFKGELGIDIYKTRFDKAARHVHMPKVNTVLFRVDCPDDTKSRVLSDLLGAPVTVGHANDGSRKSYTEKYEAVKALASFPAAFIDRIYGSRFCRHFWTPDEIAALKAKWTAPV